MSCWQAPRRVDGRRDVSFGRHEVGRSADRARGADAAGVDLAGLGPGRRTPARVLGVDGPQGRQLELHHHRHHRRQRVRKRKLLTSTIGTNQPYFSSPRYEPRYDLNETFNFYDHCYHFSADGGFSLLSRPCQDSFNTSDGDPWIDVVGLCQFTECRAKDNPADFCVFPFK